MSEKLTIRAEASFRLAEQKATHYYQSLYHQVMEKTYVPILMNDIESWKQKHVHDSSVVTLFLRNKARPDSKNYHNYIRWLNQTGKLDSYLDRSVSYIYMRDLGKVLDSPATQHKIRLSVDYLKKHLIDITEKEKVEPFSMARLYRMAQRENVESTMIWVVDKLKNVAAHIPNGMDAEQAQRKLIKIIAGVVMQEVEEMGEGISSENRTRRIEKAIKLGYCYGLTYPFIDDLLDAKVLTTKEEKQYSDLIRTTLITGNVPELGIWTGSNKALIHYIHTELKEAFDFIKKHQRHETRNSFFEQCYVFFHSQEIDRVKDLTNAHYTNEELYVPVILKSASSRLIVRSVTSAPLDEDYDNRTFFYGIYNQLADDFTDLFHDLENGAVTPYTYYIKHHKVRPDLINPFELYWTVIWYLMHHVYHSDPKTREVILDRAINGLKRNKERLGTKTYNKVMKPLTSSMPKLNRAIQQVVRKATDVDFFDKLLRDHIITKLKQERKEQDEFVGRVKDIREHINNLLPIPKNEGVVSKSIIHAANYSLAGDGKRLRPVVTWMMGVNEYGLDESAIIPLLKSVEYMHTASLIFDDLPSQDNASIRRGRKTLHNVYDTAIAELTGLFLTQRAIREQTSLDAFDANITLQLIQYTTQVIEEMCQGQAIDLESKGKTMSVDQLNRMCYYKTGLGFEAALIMPAILAGVEDLELKSLKQFAYHAGIAFQIKDDLLDLEGDSSLLGKNTGIDANNKSSTFVSILGSEEAKKAMWDHYCLALETLLNIPRNTSFLKQVVNDMVNRER